MKTKEQRDATLLLALEAAADRLTANPDEIVEDISMGKSSVCLEDGTRSLGLSEDMVDEIFDDPGNPYELLDTIPGHSWLADVSKEPRGGMFTYRYVLAAATLPSGKRAYLEVSRDETKLVVCGVTATEADDAFMQAYIPTRARIDIPVVLYAGGTLFEIDLMRTLAKNFDYIREALTDPEASWISHEVIEAGDLRRSELGEELEQSAEDGSITEERFEAEEEALAGAPSWFLLLDDAVLSKIAALPTREDGALLRNPVAPWVRPSPALFVGELDDVALQHIVAAYVFSD